jgi:SAM-dependent methyltransferase
MKDTYTSRLEKRLAEKSDRLEEIHLEAAIDAQLVGITDSGPHNQCNNAIDSDYNPHAVPNCLSPYVPASADKISAFISFVGLHGPSDGDGLHGADVLLDIGCGDGRVCVAAAKLTGCRAIGMDISPPCIRMARAVASEEEVEHLCEFFLADATSNPEQLLSGSLDKDSLALAAALDSVTCVWLYTYPTLLRQLVPFLSLLCRRSPLSKTRIVTLTYHLSDQETETEVEDVHNDLRLYRCIR